MSHKPHSPTEIRCPSCSASLSAAGRTAGEQFSCPRCLKSVMLISTPKGLRLTTPDSGGGVTLMTRARAPAVGRANAGQVGGVASRTSTVPATLKRSTQSPVTVVRPVSAPVAGQLPSPPASALLVPRTGQSVPLGRTASGGVLAGPPGIRVASALTQTAPEPASGSSRWPAVSAVVATGLVAGLVFLSPAGHDRLLRWDTGADHASNATGPLDADSPMDVPADDAVRESGSTSEPEVIASTVPASPPAATTAGPKLADVPDRTASTAMSNVELSTSEIVRRCEPSVCMVRTQMGGLGTGFVVGPNLVATNEHVVGLSDPTNVVVHFPNGPDDRMRSVELAWAVPGRDLVLLRVADLPADAIPLPIAVTRDLTKGERLIVIGHPGGLRYVVTEGLFGSTQIMDTQEFLQLSLSINPGNSGGPALTARGHVAGVVTLKSAQEGIGLAIPGAVLSEALSRVESGLTDDMTRKLRRWRTRQVGSRLVAGCFLSSELIARYLASGRAQQDRGGDPDRGVSDARSMSTESLERLAQLRREVAAGQSHSTGSHLDGEEHRIIEQLAAGFDVLAGNASSPDVRFTQLERDTVGPLREWPRLKERLDSTLGLLGLESEVIATIGR